MASGLGAMNRRLDRSIKGESSAGHKPGWVCANSCFLGDTAREWQLGAGFLVILNYVFASILLKASTRLRTNSR